MKILIINGPNLNLLGKREPEIYGSADFNTYFEQLKEQYPQIKLVSFQSNIEGEIIDVMQKADKEFDGIILNAAGYTHTSVSIADTVAAISLPVIEVHISNIFNREDFRNKSLISPYCNGTITGLGLMVYELALQSFIIKQSF